MPTVSPSDAPRPDVDRLVDLVATLEATHAYGLSRQALLQRVKRGEIRAVYLRTGRKKGLRIAPPAQQAGLF